MNFLTQPYLLSTDSSHEMHIVWIQKNKTRGFVEFGSTQSLGNTLEATCYEITGFRAPVNGEYTKIPEDHPAVSVWQYIVKLEHLTPGQRIYYRCFNASESTKIYDFHTAPDAGSDYRFAQISDLQGLNDCEESVYRIGCTHPDFILYSGDSVYVSWQLNQWFDTGEDWQDEISKKRAFFPCMQQENGARLLQYAPLFLCPGNHEVDDMRCCTNAEFHQDNSRWNWSIFMQLFRPLYPDPNTTATGKRWYAADYADLHILSLSINRICTWDPYKAPGWRMYDPIAPGSPQFKWLQQELEASDAKFKWIIQHFHILNTGKDVQFHLCDPEIDGDGNVRYPHDHESALMDLYSKHGVNAVTFGHSHVYERYFRTSTHYIEAAYLSICYRKADAPDHPSGLLPIVEDNSRRAFLTVERKKGGLFATGYYVAEPPIPFDTYRIADENGNSVPPPAL